MTALDEKGTPVGHFLVRKADYEDAEARVGFIVTAPEIRGKGLGKEFCRPDPAVCIPGAGDEKGVPGGV